MQTLAIAGINARKKKKVDRRSPQNFTKSSSGFLLDFAGIPMYYIFCLLNPLSPTYLKERCEFLGNSCPHPMLRKSYPQNPLSFLFLFYQLLYSHGSYIMKFPSYVRRSNSLKRFKCLLITLLGSIIFLIFCVLLLVNVRYT